MLTSLNIDEQINLEDQKATVVGNVKITTSKRELKLYKDADLNSWTDEDTEGLYNMVQSLRERAKDIREANILEEASVKISTKKALTEAEIQTILEAQNKLVQDQQGFIQQVQNGLDNSALLDKLKAEQFEREKLIKQQVEQAQRQKTISDAIRGTAGIISTLTAISGIMSTLTDKDIEPWDKFKRIITTIVATTPSIIMAFKGIKAIIPALTIGMQTLATSIGVTGEVAKMSFGEATAAVLTFEVACVPLWTILLAVTAAVTAIGIAVYKYQKEQNAANEALEKATQRAENAKKSFQ